MKLSAAAPRTAWVVAHRGASRDCPANTLAAFDEAIRQGCDAIELDLQLSRDGVPVVYHDRTLSRAGGGRRRVAQLDLDELKRLDAGAGSDPVFRGEPIPTLEQVLHRYSGRVSLLLEIKTREGRAGAERHLELARRVAALLRRRRVARRVFVACFDSTVLEALADAAPEVPRVLNVRTRLGLKRTIRETASLSALSVDIRALTSVFASFVRGAKLPLMTFTCNTRRRVELALQCGARAVVTDRPGWLAAYLQERTDRP